MVLQHTPGKEHVCSKRAAPAPDPRHLWVHLADRYTRWCPLARLHDVRCGLHARPVKAPSTLGTFLRSFRWGHVRQLDRVSRELLARAWAAGAGPGNAPFTIDLDSTLETYGLAKEGARHHGWQAGLSPAEPGTC